LRRGLFQVHLWTGIGLGLYVFAICVSGSIVVFRVELSRAAATEPVLVQAAGDRLGMEDLKRAAEARHSGFTASQVWEPKEPRQAVEVRLQRDAASRVRLFDPYTGEDLGNAVPLLLRTLTWLVDFHDNLLNGAQGRALNAVGGALTAVLCLTGLVIWWPGVQAWRRSLLLTRTSSWKRFNWSLHSVVGIWSVAFLLMWALTGVYLGYQQPFMDLVDYLEPFDPESFDPRVGDQVLAWLGRLHFGRRVWGMPGKILWAVAGLAPAVLFVTGAVMWWNRVLRFGVRSSGQRIDLLPAAARPASEPPGVVPTVLGAGRERRLS
jgi:uncharacterized iron-regulated membrane protein